MFLRRQGKIKTNERKGWIEAKCPGCRERGSYIGDDASDGFMCENDDCDVEEYSGEEDKVFECPKCNKNTAVQKDRGWRNFREGIYEVPVKCMSCDSREIIATRELEFEEDSVTCAVCGKRFLPDDFPGFDSCSECLESKTFIHLSHIRGKRFGVIVPAPTDVVYIHQTGGIMCRQVKIEGVFVPLRPPELWDEDEEEYIDLLQKLKEANYSYNTEEVADIWEKINEEIEIEYERSGAPEDYMPRSAEAIKWIKITSNSADDRLAKLDNLEDKPVALIYENCD